MTIREILSAVEAALTPWAATNKGRVQVASDPFHLFNLLAAAPGVFRVGVLWKAETKRGDYEEAGMVDDSFLVVLSRGKGFTEDPGASVTKGSAGGAPLYDMVEACRDVVRAITLEDTTEVTFDYTGAGPYEMPFAILVDAIQLQFSIGKQMPAAVTG